MTWVNMNDRALRKVEHITACCCSKDRAFLALAERCVSEALVRIYDLRSGNSGPVKALRPIGLAAGRLVALAFSAPVEGASAGPRYLLSSTHGAEAMLQLMNWAPKAFARLRKDAQDAEKVLCKCKLPGAVDRLCFPLQPENLQALFSSH